LGAATTKLGAKGRDLGRDGDDRALESLESILQRRR
jgi:hypothetical protein